MIWVLPFLLLLAGKVSVNSAFHSGNSEEKQFIDLFSRMEKLERLLQEQDGKILRQESLLRHDNLLLRRQGAKLKNQETLLRAQREEIKLLKTRLLDHEKKFFSLEQWNQRPKPEELNNETATSTKERVNLLKSDAGNTQFYASAQRAKSQNEVSASALHTVMPRSDDAGPLELVVNHLSQQVTEMGADMQAFKTQTSGDIQALKNSNRQQDLAIQDAQSSTFVHWGSTTCSNASQLVYSGVVGGSHYTHSGGAANYLCLTMSPVLSSRSPTADSFLYGAEYSTHDSYHDKDPVCAVCRSPFTTTVMVPGTNVCTPGWHLQYSGYLMAGRYTQYRSESICVDSRLESRVGSDDDENGAVLYLITTRCGSLPCAPYVNNKIVTCAVCSK